MAYPDDKETFRRVVNQELPDIPGDVLDENDQNLPADFLERLQDTLGYNLKMGFASVKLFFDDIVSKFAGIKKVEMISIYNAPGPGRQVADYHGEFGKSFAVTENDLIFFQSYLLWRRYENIAAEIKMFIMKSGSSISPSYLFEGIENQGRLSSLINWVYTAPSTESPLFKVRIEVIEDEVYLEQICFTAIKISI